VTDIQGKPLDGYRFGESVPLAGDETAWTPTWKSGRLLHQQTDKLLRLEAWKSSIGLSIFYLVELYLGEPQVVRPGTE
jgi:hypothetical protein